MITGTLRRTTTLTTGGIAIIGVLPVCSFGDAARHRASI
jgi:hypothetical protein